MTYYSDMRLYVSLSTYFFINMVHLLITVLPVQLLLVYLSVYAHRNTCVIIAYFTA